MLDKAIVGGCAVFLALSTWAAIGPGGLGLPVWALAALAGSLTLLLLGHMWKHLGGPLLAAFVVTSAAVEWAFEQANISFGGFIWGDIRYGNLGVFAAHLGDVPIAVPVLMAVMLWPTYAMVNLALDGQVTVDPRTVAWWQVVWRCALYGLVHSWLMLVYNGDCEEFGVYRWVGRSLNHPAADMFLGDPTAPRGWAIYVFITMLAISFIVVPRVGATALRRTARRPLNWADAAPIALFGVMGVVTYVNPPNATIGNVALWTMGFFAAFVGYRFVALMRETRQLPNEVIRADAAAP